MTCWVYDADSENAKRVVGFGYTYFDLLKL